MHGTTTRAGGFLLLAVAAGCGGSGKTWTYNNQVEGTVKIDGVPLAAVVVEFVPDDPKVQGPVSRAYTDENGRFQLKADKGKSGAVIARHLVTVIPGRGADAQADPQAGDGKARPKNPPVPPYYRTVKDTPLVVDVTADNHTYDLNLSRTAGARPVK